MAASFYSFREAHAPDEARTYFAMKEGKNMERECEKPNFRAVGDRKASNAPRTNSEPASYNNAASEVTNRAKSAVQVTKHGPFEMRREQQASSPPPKTDLKLLQA